MLRVTLAAAAIILCLIGMHLSAVPL